MLVSSVVMLVIIISYTHASLCYFLKLNVADVEFMSLLLSTSYFWLVSLADVLLDVGNLGHFYFATVFWLC